VSALLVPLLGSSSHASFSASETTTTVAAPIARRRRRSADDMTRMLHVSRDSRQPRDAVDP
jgi:hypothetical protein